MDNTPVFHSTASSANFALTGHVIYTESDVYEAAECMSYCLMQEGCVSFNFNQQGRLCELNDVTKKDDGAAYKPSAGFVYYEQNSALHVFSVP